MPQPKPTAFEKTVKAVYILDELGVPTGFAENPLPVESTFSDGPSVDAFARLRVSNPTTLFDVQMQYDRQLAFWYEKLTGGGNVQHQPNHSAVDLIVGTASGDKVTRQTRQYVRYQPGKSQLVFATGNLGTGQSGVSQRIGYFDDDNGLFFECKDGVMGVVLRSKTSGTIINNRFIQSDWNIDGMGDSLNSLNPTGILIDWNKAQVFVIDLEWLSVGRIRFGLYLGGRLRYVHAINNANIQPGAYMSTANLPVRYEIENTAIASKGSTMKQICTTVISEGGFQTDLGLPVHIGNSSVVNVNSELPVLSIRPKALFNNIVNRAGFLFEDVTVFSEDNDAHFKVYLGGTLTDPSWSDVNTTFSTMEFDVAATAFTGGLLVGGGYAEAGGIGSNSVGGKSAISLLAKLAMSLDIDGNHPTVANAELSDVLTVTASTIAGAASDILAGISWQEQK